ncbi:hypothetical protein CYMTET_50345 [Cymbomonas tetramitiformis]|uniref:LrgB-like protein n=1 Tax=Cymbomonas tetramitiformis TaxID=36881 RepID=A0AAE0ESX6_9CHLO|nr:hypothetical protein CYMTET_50345 [Cymbomonas tetramitiformis]
MHSGVTYTSSATMIRNLPTPRLDPLILSRSRSSLQTGFTLRRSRGGIAVARRGSLARAESSNFYSGEGCGRIRRVPVDKPRTAPPCWARGANAALYLATTRREVRMAAADATGAQASSSEFIRGSKLLEGLCAAAGVAFLVAWQRSCGAAVSALHLQVPPTVAALLLLQALLLLPPLRLRIHRLLAPASRFLDTWIGLIFVPFITGLFVAAVPTGRTLLTVVACMCLSWLATVAITATVTAALSPPQESIAAAAAAAERDCSEGVNCRVDFLDEDEVMKRRQVEGKEVAARLYNQISTRCALLAVFVTAALIPVVPLLAEWLAWLSSTVVLYRLAQKLPSSWQRKGLFPTVTAGVTLGAACWLLGGRAAVATYNTTVGAALLCLVAPAVIATSLKIDAQRATLMSIWRPLMGAILVAVPAGLVIAAALGRACGLDAQLVLATLPKNTTTGLAISMAASLDVSATLAAAGVVFCGTLGLALGIPILDTLGIRLPIARGAAMGISSHTAGTLALDIAGEDQAAAISGATFAVAGVLSVALCSFPPFRSLLLRIAGL